MKNIVIIGCGFAGFSCYKNLRKLKEVKITVIDQNSYFTYTPLLQEVVSGTLRPDSVKIQTKNVIEKNGHKFITTKINEIRQDEKIVIGANGNTYEYDYLVISTGANTNFFNNNSIKKNAEDMHDVKDALEIKEKLELLSKANKKPKITVVGTGPNGVELVSEIYDFFNDKKLKPEISITSSADRLAAQYSETTSEYVEKVFKNKNIKINLHKRVSNVENNKVFFNDDSIENADLIFWAAGVKPNYIQNNLSNKDSNRFIVNCYLQLADHKDVFVCGDVGFTRNKSLEKTQKKPVFYPMIAQVAIREGKHVAKNIKNTLNDNKLESFNYKLKGQLLSLGKYKAAGKAEILEIRGLWGFLIWNMIYLYYLQSFKNMRMVLFDWYNSYILRKKYDSQAEKFI